MVLYLLLALFKLTLHDNLCIGPLHQLTVCHADSCLLLVHLLLQSPFLCHQGIL